MYTTVGKYEYSTVRNCLLGALEKSVAVGGGRLS